MVVGLLTLSERIVREGEITHTGTLRGNRCIHQSRVAVEN